MPTIVLFMFDLQKDPQGIYTLYFDKPPANAFDDEALRALQREIESMAQDAQCRALIFAAKGRFFSAGADIAFMGRAMQGNDGPDKLRHLAQNMQNIFRAIELLAALSWPWLVIFGSPKQASNLVCLNAKLVSSRVLGAPNA